MNSYKYSVWYIGAMTDPPTLKTVKDLSEFLWTCVRYNMHNEKNKWMCSANSAINSHGKVYILRIEQEFMGQNHDADLIFSNLFDLHHHTS